MIMMRRILLEDWIKNGFISPLNNDIHTKKERLGWTEISESLKLMGAQVDDPDMHMLLNKKIFYMNLMIYKIFIVMVIMTTLRL